MFLLVWLLLFGCVWPALTIITSDEIEGRPERSQFPSWVDVLPRLNPAHQSATVEYDAEFAPNISLNIKNGHYFPSIVKYLATGGEDKYVKRYFGKNSKINWIDPDTEQFVHFNKVQDDGLTPKGVIFHVYDDKMREEAISLYRLLAASKSTKIFHLTTAWASININEGILEYALRLAITHPTLNHEIRNIQMPSPYIVKPHYYVNGDTIRKAMSLKLKNGVFSENESLVNQYYRVDDIICINSNYSGWNLRGNGCFDKLAYFREDIGLNGYYYGIHLSYPFWMTNEELSIFRNDSERAVEHYYYLHQQLLARYWLEMEANDIPIESMKTLSQNCEFPAYNPYLQYPNSLLFPVRYPVSRTNDEVILAAKSYLKNVDTILDEFAARGLGLVETYGSTLNMTEVNFMYTVSRLIRANIDGIKYAKTLRSVYGGQIYLDNKFNPAPSVLHHPETSLRDPIYWSMISYVMDYFDKFKAHIPMHDLADYETDHFKISSTLPSIVMYTYFQYTQFNISSVVADDFDNSNQNNLTFAARQKRMTHLPLSLQFRVESKIKTPAIIRIYLGPKCNAREDCFEIYNRFYELDTMKVTLKEGANAIQWYPRRATSDCYNNNNNMNFPVNLVIPRGKSGGFLTTLFVMVTKTEDPKIHMNYDDTTQKSCNRMLKLDLDNLPLGFPFDRSSINYNPKAPNYKFFDVMIYNKIEDIPADSRFTIVNP